MLDYLMEKIWTIKLEKQISKKNRIIKNKKYHLER